MSKWSKRSDEEKLRIFNEQNALREKAEIKKDPIKSAQAQITELLQAHELPLHCFEHGHVKSQSYELTNGSFMGQKCEVVKGRCIKCGKNLSFPLTPQVRCTEFGILVIMVITLLKNEGRLTDTRK